MLEPLFESLLRFVLKLMRRQKRYRLAVLEYVAELAGRKTRRERDSDVVTSKDGEECYCEVSATSAHS